MTRFSPLVILANGPTRRPIFIFWKRNVGLKNKIGSAHGMHGRSFRPPKCKQTDKISASYSLTMQQRQVRFRFSNANCKSLTEGIRLPENSATTRQNAYLCEVASYTPIQRFVQRQDAICREFFERATATAFTQFTGQLRRFNQRIQASSGRG